MKDWFQHWGQYQRLKKWKEQEFDPKVKIAKKEAEENYLEQLKDEFQYRIKSKLKSIFVAKMRPNKIKRRSGARLNLDEI